MGRKLRKRPVISESIENAINHIEEEIVHLAEREVASNRVGERVMRELKALQHRSGSQ